MEDNSDESQDGFYDLAATWGAGNYGLVDVKVMNNGVEVFSDLADADGGSYSSSGLFLVANQTIDLRVGRYDGYNSDSTPVNLTITAVPEPNAASMLFLGLAGMTFVLRRRK